VNDQSNELPSRSQRCDGGVFREATCGVLSHVQLLRRQLEELREVVDDREQGDRDDKSASRVDVSGMNLDKQRHLSNEQTAIFATSKITYQLTVIQTIPAFSSCKVLRSNKQRQTKSFLLPLIP